MAGCASDGMTNGSTVRIAVGRSLRLSIMTCSGCANAQAGSIRLRHHGQASPAAPVKVLDLEEGRGVRPDRDEPKGLSGGVAIPIRGRTRRSDKRIHRNHACPPRFDTGMPMSYARVGELATHELQTAAFVAAIDAALHQRDAYRAHLFRKECAELFDYGAPWRRARQGVPAFRQTKAAFWSLSQWLAGRTHPPVMLWPTGRSPRQRARGTPPPPETQPRNECPICQSLLSPPSRVTSSPGS